MTAFAADRSHRIDLTLSRSYAQVDLSGEIDMLTAPQLSSLFGSLEQIHNDVRVNLAEVTFMDTAGLWPLIEATRSRRQLQLGPVLIGPCSRPVLRLMHLLGIDAAPF